ncbi:MAG: ATP synthase subunit I [Syntrophobacteria bacterium]
MILQDETLLKRIEKVIWALLAGFSIASFAFFTPRFALGVVLGGTLAIANFFLMKRSLRRALDPYRRGGTRFLYLLKYYLRLAVIGVIIAVLLITGRVSPFGLFVGLSIIVIGIGLVGVNEARKLIFKGVA